MSLIELAGVGVGGRAVACNDEFFAPVANLIADGVPQWHEGEYTDRGKWMDGWETRRRREPGHDWAIIGVGLPGVVEEVVVDTAHFKGNYPESFSLEACGVGTDERLEEAEWVEIVPLTPLAGDTANRFEVASQSRVTHLRLNIFPDGGVARLRVMGTPIPAHDQVCPDRAYAEMAGLAVGGEMIGVSDDFFSDPGRMLRPGPSAGMFDGWETRRRRGQGNDWAIVRLGLAGIPRTAVVDTTHFKGNAPGWVSIEGGQNPNGPWKELLPMSPVSADTENRFELEPADCSLVRLSIFPDGGVARLRLFGQASGEAAAAARLRYLNSLFEQEARRFFQTACHARAFEEQMMSARPYVSVNQVLEGADSCLSGLSGDQLREAFTAHPRIGERRGGQEAEGEAMSRSEQAGAGRADPGTLARLAAGNAAYESRFGFPFIVAAAGRSAAEVLEVLETRIHNDAEHELAEAAAAQKLITRRRLEKMLCVGGG
ncbi:MAG TPA: allantoicase [Acidimicrobiia bacterium]